VLIQMPPEERMDETVNFVKNLGEGQVFRDKDSTNGKAVFSNWEKYTEKPVEPAPVVPTPVAQTVASTAAAEKDATYCGKDGDKCKCMANGFGLGRWENKLGATCKGRFVGKPCNDVDNSWIHGDKDSIGSTCELRAVKGASFLALGRGGSSDNKEN